MIIDEMDSETKEREQCLDDLTNQVLEKEKELAELKASMNIIQRIVLVLVSFIDSF